MYGQKQSSFLRFSCAPAVATLPAVHAEWDGLAEKAGSPFLTSAWLQSIAAVHPAGVQCLLGREEDGALRAGACVIPLRPIGLSSAAHDLFFEEWALLGDETARPLLWQQLAEQARGRIKLTGLRRTDAGHGAEEAEQNLRAAGYVTVAHSRLANPRLELPADWDSLIGGVSRNLRSQYRRHRRQLERHGALTLRTVDQSEAPPFIESFLRMEAAGWKGRAGTAILSSPSDADRYRQFFRAAAREGWLRLQFLELAGTAIAADASCVFNNGVFMLKTAYDERLSEASPGLVMRAEALRSAVADGMRFYDLLGAPEPYKLRWGATPAEFISMHAYRGVGAPVLANYRRHIRPALKQARDAARAWSAR